MGNPALSIYNSVMLKIAMPLSDIGGQSKRKLLVFLGESQYWSKEQIEEFQSKRLCELINRAYLNVPFYRDLLDSHGVRPSMIKSISDLPLLPVLTKNDIRMGINSGRLLDTTMDVRKLERNNSSGSTGEPLHFYLNSEASRIKKASAIRAWQWMGFSFGDKILRLSPLPRLGVLKKIQDRATRTKYMQAVKLTENEFELILRELKTFRPSILRSYPDPLYIFAEYIKGKSISLPSLKAINTTGSTLFDHYRESIEAAFSCKMFDSFSCEGGAVVSQCPSSRLYHAADECAITEILDINGYPSSKGRLVTTDLWNYATPFIRYDTQDMVERSDEPCNCGRCLTAIKRIFGRSSDILITADRQYLFANNFTGYFQGLSGVDQYQVYQKSRSTLILRIKPGYGFNAETESQIRAIMSSLIGGSTQVSIELVDDIPLSNSGKRRFLIRDDSIPLEF